MSERKMATVRQIAQVQKHPNADSLDIVTVDGWNVIAKLGEYKEGDLCIYCEIDSFLPIREEFEFLRKSSYKNNEAGEGFRLKTMKLRGSVSQGLVLPITLLNEEDREIGKDVSEILGITKYEPPIPAQLAGKIKGNFPSFLQKTDEERIQNLGNILTDYADQPFYVAEKLDGSSVTFYLRDGIFGVCSRNLDLLETEGNSFWEVAKRLNVEEKMKSVRSRFNYDFAIQGELVGPGVQGNKYGLPQTNVYFFNLFNIDSFSYVGLGEFRSIIGDIMELDIVPILDENFILPRSIKEVLEYADGTSVLNPKAEREGVVIRSLDRVVSFKAISNSFLLSEKD